jgi:hypothetical protein
MTDLVLVNIDEDDKVLATVVADGDKIKVTGSQAEAARTIVENRAKLMDLPPGKSLDRLAEYGWTNGIWVLRGK